MKVNRTLSVLKNLCSNIVLQAVTLILFFVTRSVFILKLNETFLGINGLFTNVLGVLSISELGVGTALTYYLYKPAEENNVERLKSIMFFYKNCYKVVGVIMLIVGLLIIPAIPYLVNLENGSDVNLYLVYVLFLINSAISYFLYSYRQSIYIAYQNNHQLLNIQTIIKIVSAVISIVLLCLYSNYYAYLILNIIISIITSVVIGYKAGKEYCFLNDKEVKQIDASEKKDILKDVYSVFVWKVGNTFMISTDNILISVICGTILVGYYSNYCMVMSSVVMVYSIVLNSWLPSVGNINAIEDDEYKKNVMESLHIINYWILTFCSISLMTLLNPFIKIWMGCISAKDNYVLSELIPMVMGANLFFTWYTSVFGQFKDTMGLFKYGRYNQLIMGVVNLFLSVILGNLFGLTGILTGTFLSILICCTFFYPYYVYRYGLRMDGGFYWKREIIEIINFFVLYLVTRGMMLWIIIDNIYTFIIRVLICLIVPNVFLYIRYRNCREINMVLKKIKRIHIAN